MWNLLGFLGRCLCDSEELLAQTCLKASWSDCKSKSGRAAADAAGLKFGRPLLLVRVSSEGFAKLLLSLPCGAGWEGCRRVKTQKSQDVPSWRSLVLMPFFRTAECHHKPLKQPCQCLPVLRFAVTSAGCEEPALELLIPSKWAALEPGKVLAAHSILLCRVDSNSSSWGGCREAAAPLTSPPQIQFRLSPSASPFPGP